VICLPSMEQITVPVSRCSLYREVDDYQWADDQDAEEHLHEDHMSEVSLEALEVEERNDWSHMEVDDSGDVTRRGYGSPKATKPPLVRKVTMPGSYSPSPPSPPSDYDEATTGVSSSATEIECASPAAPTKSISSDEDVRMMLTESERSPDPDKIEELDDLDHWKHFDILPAAPVDHAFYTVEPPQPSKAFLSRISKEYRVLESSLPGSILVRAYEDRTDLLRCLIIGPHNTPYEDAPFVIDWRLDGSFPQTPPVAHFLSWTNGNGRVNP
jgi:ubiquitin-conjugating enzyme E2 O